MFIQCSSSATRWCHLFAFMSTISEFMSYNCELLLSCDFSLTLLSLWGYFSLSFYLLSVMHNFGLHNFHTTFRNKLLIWCLCFSVNLHQYVVDSSLYLET